MVMGQRTVWGIPFDAINAAARAQLPSLLREWLPNGKRVGHEWRVGSINGEAGESFSVNMQTGKWAEFNGRGDTGGDVLGLYAAKFCQGDRVQAARDLADKLGKQRAWPQPKPKAKSDDGHWVSLIPPPADAGRPPDTMLSGFDMLHGYTSIEDRETHFVGRIEARGDKPKHFVPITYGVLNGERGWHNKAPNPPRPLYGLNKLTTMPDASVIVCEGEKAADAAQQLFPGYACMSWFGGVAQVKHADLSPLANRRVIVWPDADEPGLDAMRELLQRLPADTQVVRVDDLRDGFDADDLERQGCDDPAAWLNERLQLNEPRSKPEPKPHPGGDSPGWPDPLGLVAQPGIVGEFISALVPHTEADTAALVFQFLAAAGNLIGAGPYYQVESDRHPARLNVLPVGTTAKGRKGTSWGRVRWPFSIVDPTWNQTRIVSGLSSGEGLIYPVRDPVEKTNKNGERETIDEGVTDKRLLVISSEFAGILPVMTRSGNTLSPIIRDAWDHGNLQTLTKNSPLRATGAHIGQIGHCTATELLQHLDAVQVGNGFANRYLYVCVRRARSLPDGSEYIDWEPFAQRLNTIITKAKRVERVTMDERARELWHAEYDRLSAPKPGMLGAIVARAEAQVVRLALIYAVLGEHTVITEPDLRAALECWRYAEQSAHYIFTDKLGDPIADTILAALRQAPDGLTETDIRDLFHRNAKPNQLDRALQRLQAEGLTTFTQEKTGGPGRPPTRWRAVDPGREGAFESNGPTT